MEDEKLYSKLDEEIKKLNAEREKIETKFDVATDIFDEYINNMNKPSGGSGGSGGSSASKPSKDKEIENIELKYDRYQQLERELANVNDELEKNKILSENANGIEQIEYLKEEISLLEKKKEALKNIQDERSKELAEMKRHLEQYGFTFDMDGDFTDLANKIKQLEVWANSGDKKVNQEAAKKVYDTIKAYDELRGSINSTNNEILELNNSIKDVYKEQLDLVANAEKEIYEVIEHYEGKKKDAKIKAIEEQRKALEELYALEDRNDDLEKKQSNLPDIKNQMDLYENAQDSAGKVKYEELKKQYDDLLKELNTTIRDNQKDSILDSLEAQKENVEKEYEEFLKPENINKIISDAMKDGYIKLGDEVLDLNNATTQYLAETTKGTQSLINANHELLNSYLSIMEIAKDLPKLNANVGNIGINMNTVHSSIPRSNIGKSVNFENITVQITGGTNMNQADITKAVQKAFIDISNNYKF